MSFLPQQLNIRRVSGEGPKDAKIAIVGEAPGGHENIQLRPFVGPAGSVLESCLHAAGLIRSEVYLTNVVKVQPKGNDIKPFFDGRTFSQAGQDYLIELRRELDEVRPNVVVACGATALAAITGLTKITKLRGYVCPTIGLEHTRKAVPCIHPAASLYDRRGGGGTLATSEFKPYLYRHVIVMDLLKAKEESRFPELKRPDRQLVWDFNNIDECLDWLSFYENEPLVCFDIEVTNYELACISFSSSPGIAISVPIAGRWSLGDEAKVWQAIQRVLKAPSVKVVQNGIFDVHFLLTRCGIEVAGEIHDTMIGHSVMFPELPKGLEFLGSVYCGSQAYWKDTVKFNNIKEES